MRTLIACLAVLLAGCEMVGPDYAPPDLETPAAFETPAPPEVGRVVMPAWWQGYGDATLEDLARRALAGNLEIEAAAARLDEARALVRVARADGGPSLDAGADAAVEGRAGRGVSSDVEGFADASLLFNWTPDLFGGQRRGVEAAEAEVRRQALLREDLARLAVADVVRRYVDVRRDEAQLRLLAQSFELQQQTLSLAQSRFDAGIAARLDVSRAEADLAETRARRGPFQEDLAAARAALAVLIGQPPGAVALPPGAPMPVYGGGPPIGLPRDLLRVRPDVRAAEAALARTTAAIGVAEADLYPRLTIPGVLTAGVAGIGTGDVIERLVASLAASLNIPLFDAGGRQARVDVGEARAREALVAYRATLLDALAEAETALARVEATERRRLALIDAVDASQRAFDEAESLYTQGIVGFLDVLDARRTLLTNQQNLVEAEADAALAIADLYSAVGSYVRCDDCAV